MNQQTSSQTKSPSQPEAWLRGPIPGVDPLVAPVFHSFRQVREELAEYAAGLETDQVWRVLAGTSLGFHLSHIAGSVDRLSTYLAGKPLTDAQLQFLGHEPESGASLATLLVLVDDRLSACEERLRQISPASLAEPRTVGRRELPTTVIGLIIHLAEHTQRHLGQAILLSKLLREASAKGTDSALAGSEGTGEVAAARPPATILPDTFKN